MFLQVTCEPDEFLCLNGNATCIAARLRCDGIDDCVDGEDERDCDEVKIWCLVFVSV